MEFKGTKGKWLIGNGRTVISEDIHQSTDKDKREGFSDFEHYGGLLVCESIRKPEDALLISKAPEMLEMLKRVLDVNEHHGFDGHSVNKQIEKIIREATEL